MADLTVDAGGVRRIGSLVQTVSADVRGEDGASFTFGLPSTGSDLVSHAVYAAAIQVTARVNVVADSLATLGGAPAAVSDALADADGSLARMAGE